MLLYKLHASVTLSLMRCHNDTESVKKPKYITLNGLPSEKPTKILTNFRVVDA